MQLVRNSGRHLSAYGVFLLWSLKYPFYGRGQDTHIVPALSVIEMIDDIVEGGLICTCLHFYLYLLFFTFCFYIVSFWAIILFRFLFSCFFLLATVLRLPFLFLALFLSLLTLKGSPFLCSSNLITRYQGSRLKCSIDALTSDNTFLFWNFF